jgi:hypothetical protein
VKRRIVRVHPVFFDFLDDLLGSERIDGRPSSTDFLVHELPGIIDQLADDYKGSTVQVGDDPSVRLCYTGGFLVRAMAVYITEFPDESLEIVDLDLDFFDPNTE